MGSYIGSALSRLATGYLDEKKNQDALERQRRLDAQNEEEKQAIARDRQTQLQRLQEQMDYTQQRTTMRDNEQDADRKAFPEMFQKARAGDESALGWVLNRYPQMATALTKPEPQERSLTWRNDVRGDDGKAYQVGVDASGKEVKRLPQFVKPNENDALGWARLNLEREKMSKGSSANRPLTESERRNGALLTMAEQANTGLRGFGNVEAPGWMDRQKSKVGLDIGNVLSPDKYQQMQQYALQLSDSWLRFTSGAAVPETEVQRFAKAFTPLPGDSPATLTQKAKAREKIIQAMRQGAGRAVPDAAANTASSVADLWPE